MDLSTLFTFEFSLLFASLFPFFILLWIFRRPRTLLATFSSECDQAPIEPRCSVALALVLASAAGLFTELMIIRIHSSFFQIFGYYKNVSLLSCFLGLGLGLAYPSLLKRWVFLAGPLLAIQLSVLTILRHTGLEDWLLNPSLEYGTMGLNQTMDVALILLSNCFLLTIFVFNALCFVPLGNLIAHFSKGMQNFQAYSLNLLGSILGIVLFSLLSMLYTPPPVWLIVCTVMILPLFGRSLFWVSSWCISTLVVLGFFSIQFEPLITDYYSPYQKISLVASPTGRNHLLVNNFYYQRLIDVDESENLSSEEQKHYEVPYQIKKKPERVLVLGSGTGNDVAAALKHGSQQVDAVEIDPLIYYMGKELHPSKPYLSPKVNIIIDDARAHLKRSSATYDLIVYGLLDSHTALSGKGAIRLDSYVYTIDAFRQAKAALAHDGALCLSFAIGIHSDFLLQKIRDMLTIAFDGKEPYIFISQYDAGVSYCTSETLDIEGLNANLPETFQITREKKDLDLATDDWPFLFMRGKFFPVTYFLTFLVMVPLSAFMIRAVMGKKDSAPQYPWRAFFLGTGFMLVETKAITELALVFGSTWYVISVTILFVLVMAYLANLLAQRYQSVPDWIMFLCLFLALGFGIYFSMDLQSEFSTETLKVLSPIVLTIPLFFSGYCFSQELKRFDSLGPVLSANLFGGLLGGILEYNALQFGYLSLYFIALVVYLLAFVSPLVLSQDKAQDKALLDS